MGQVDLTESLRAWLSFTFSSFSWFPVMLGLNLKQTTLMPGGARSSKSLSGNHFTKLGSKTDMKSYFLPEPHTIYPNNAQSLGLWNLLPSGIPSQQ